MPIRKGIEDNLEILTFLSTCGAFDLNNCRLYIALSAKLGKPFDANATRQLESANRIVGGYERLRKDSLIPSHLKAFETLYKTLVDLMAVRPDPGTLKFLGEAQQKFAAIAAQLSGSAGHGH